MKLSDLQQRDDHWAIIDLYGKGSHVRTVPVPNWVKAAVDAWLATGGIGDGFIFRCVTHAGTVWGSGISEKVVWWAVRQYAKIAEIEKLSPMTFAAPVHGFVTRPGVSLNRFNFSSVIDL